MRRRLSKREYVLAGLFALIAMFPLATDSDGEDLDVLPPLGTLVGPHEMLKLRETRAEQNRANAKLLEICQNRAQTDPDIVCPDVNDAPAIHLFLRGLPVIHPAADDGESMNEALSIFDLTETQRGWLRRYQRVRVCPETLDAVVPGLFELCEDILEKTEDSRPRLDGDRMIPTSVFPMLKPTLEQLIEMQKPE